MSLGGGGSGELQELSQQIEEVESQIEALDTQIENLQAEKADVDEAIEAIEKLETGSTVQVPLGGGAYVRASVEDIDEVIVGLGGGYAAERTQEGAVELLEDRKDQIDGRIEELSEERAELESEEEELNQRAQQLQQQQLQQQLQQQQGGLGGSEDEDADE